MSNTFYAPGEQRAAKVNDLFAAIARRYDLINDLQSFGLHRLWKHRVVTLAAVKSGDRALDLCCGTGDLALALAQRGAETTGLDFSEKMLEVAKNRRQKAEAGSQRSEAGSQRSEAGSQRSEAGSQRSEAGSQKAEDGRRKTDSKLRLPVFRQGDAQQLPFPENSFDIVTVGYGLRNLASWERGLDEMFRVAKPGGRIVVLEFGKPANPPWRKIYFAHLRCSVPLIGLLFCGNAQAYAYILESLKHYPGQLAVAEKMRGLNLANVRVINLLGGAMAINYGEKPK